MHILIIGGSGRTGKLTISELLRQGHQVTALVRNPASMVDFPDVNVVEGTPTNIENVRDAFKIQAPDAVVVTLSAPRASDSPFAAPISPPRLMADSNANVISVMKEFKVSKIVILQAFGVGASWDNMPCLMRGLMSMSNMSYQYTDHNHTDREVRQSGVTYVMVRPSRLVESDAMDLHEWSNDGKGVPLMASASRKSVASFLVDTAVQTKWDNSCPVITN
ncbi:hypothetical protein N7509_003334 [Penicillium cosmopolitanum]|uniref:NAD(P)-binding domain-containing protein n=1 Tax=Penicillium cosmopolitanum TaxID=1131564 RepID=A0A9W9W536_9EURO|nr:uncharacterized protein N7509_003334 [Penicillium cosmopolitanum]KAJ5403463.1 hypothetical protein N7509_003334 [Penicillium cosmopolitanum]